MFLKSMFIACSLGLASAAMADTITMRADVWCPFNCDPKDPNPGFMIEVAKAALEGAGHKIDYQTLNWARAISETRLGNFDAIVGASKTDAPDFTFPEVALGRTKNCFFAKKDATWEYKGLASLANATVGVIKDYSYAKAFDDYVKANAKDSKKVDVVSGDNPLELNLKKLQMGRITTFVEDDSVMKSYQFKKKSDDVKNVGCIEDADTSLYIAFGPKSAKGKEFAKLLSDKIAQMRKDGTLKTILEKYGISDWQ